MGVIRRVSAWFLGQLDGRASAHVVAVFAGVFVLDSADKAAVGAMAIQLEQGLGIGQAELGLLLTVSSGVGAAATLPFGWLADRTKRIRILAITVLLWAVAMGLSAAAQSYRDLLLIRLALGAVAAAAVPIVASLVGDYFQPHRRGRIYGYILAGELIGTGCGYILSGELVLLSWRAGFLGLALPALLVAWLVHRLPEPARGGADRLTPGQKHLPRHPSGGDRAGGHEDIAVLTLGSQIREMIRTAAIQPRMELVHDEDPRRKSLGWAARYVLHIPTNLVLIIASALGYYYFAGMRTFGVELAQSWYGLGHSVAIGLVVLFGLSGLAGALAGGRLADRLLARRYLPARVLVATFAYLAGAVALVPALLTPLPLLAVPPLMAAGFSLGAVNPPLDAARLDIMHPYLWGRAESVRACLRLVGEAAGPLMFGYAADQVFGGGVVGLQRTFLLMLVPLFISGWIGFIAFRTYPRDVATADAYSLRTREIERREKK